MFDSLEDRIKHDVAEQSSTKERMFRYVLILIVSVVLFAGLFEAVRLLG
jgi:hypothetical protein